MSRYNKNLKRRRENAKYYINKIKKIKELTIQDFDKKNSYFILQVFFKNKKIRNKILLKFKENNIGCSIHYATPVPLMTYYKKKYNLNKKKFPCAVKYGENSISLPTHPFIEKKMIDKILKVIVKNL